MRRPPVATRPPADTTKPGDGSPASMSPNPFTAASFRLTEPFLDASLPLTDSSQSFDITDIPARGFLRGVWLWLTSSGGVAGAGALDSEAPWSLLDRVEIQDVVTSPIVSLNGWELYVVNLLGGYHWHSNLVDDPNYASSVAAPGFMIWVPIEARSRDALGCLPNQDGANPLRLRVQLAASGDVYSAAPTTAPRIRLRAFDEHWAVPTASDLSGRPNTQMPPMVGLTSYWGRESHNVPVGNTDFRLQRVGDWLRNLILIGRDANGDRSNDVLPNPLEVRYDGVVLSTQPRELAWTKQNRNIPRAITAGDRPAGVLLLPYCDDLDGHSGDEVGDSYLKTTSATRLEFRGPVKTAGTVTVLTNSLSPPGA